MVDFRQKLAGKKIAAPTNPVLLYDTLDRAHDKGPLRPAQESVLNQWFTGHANEKDVIVKLHTGQGKTLVGLLMLQSKLNEKKCPSLYLCPNNYLVSQTCEQASQFGIATCTTDDDLPDDFLGGNKIFVTSVQKLFNGLTKFKLYKNSIDVGALLIDDAHACSDSIRQACKITIKREEPAYSVLLDLFANQLECQGYGTFADIVNKKRDALLPVPYWSWLDHESDTARILSEYSNSKSIKFAWPLLKNSLRYCQCIFSGQSLEIEPFAPPLDAFGSYTNAECRIFMSATVTDDAFLIKGLHLSPETVLNPLTFENEKWSGEKMILIPSLIDKSLTRELLVEKFAKPNENRNLGFVVLSPGFDWTKDWSAYGAVVANTETVDDSIALLMSGDFSKTIVLVNRYDGIDLPDRTCRILIFDGKPFSESLIDLYDEQCRPNSAATLMRTLRTVEQGMGRSVRGEKDFSAIIILGQPLVRLLREKKSRSYLSAQMATQISIGLELVELAKQDISDGSSPYKALNDLIRQCIGRDDAWKEYYKENMDIMLGKSQNENSLDCYAHELRAEKLYISGKYNDASQEIQKLIDKSPYARDDKGWYLQIMARYNYRANRAESNKFQIAAYETNKTLLKPAEGVTVTRLTLISHGRVERIVKWVSQFLTYADLDIVISDILENLVFSVKSDNFEKALHELSKALGFVGERPDKEWKEGPDNLWALNDKQYILFECKNEVKLERAEINKSESEQMNSSCAWFERHYKGMNCKNIIIHPAKKLASSAAFTHPVEVIRVSELKKLTKNVRLFFSSFQSFDFSDMSTTQIQKLLDSHSFDVDNILNSYAVSIKQY